MHESKWCIHGVSDQSYCGSGCHDRKLSDPDFYRGWIACNLPYSRSDSLTKEEDGSRPVRPNLDAEVNEHFRSNDVFERSHAVRQRQRDLWKDAKPTTSAEVRELFVSLVDAGDPAVAGLEEASVDLVAVAQVEEGRVVVGKF